MNYSGLIILSGILHMLCSSIDSVQAKEYISNYSTEKACASTELIQQIMQRDTIPLIKKVQLDAVHINSKQHAKDTRTHWQLSQQNIRENMGKDLAQQLAQIPGVSVLKTGSTINKPIINGLYGSRIILLNNGVKHESQQWGNDHAPEIDPFFFKQVSVVKNADAVRYGAEAMGGIVQLEPLPFDSTAFAGQINVIGNTNGRGGILNALLEGHINKLHYRGSITAGKSGNVKTPSYYLGNTGKEDIHANLQLAYRLKQWNLDFRLSQFNSNVGLFTGAHIGSIDDILVRIAQEEPFESYDFSYNIQSPRQHVSHQLAKLSAVKQIDENRKLAFKYSYQQNNRKEFDLRRIAADNVPMANLRLHTQQLEAIYNQLGAQIGISGTIQVNNNIAGTGTTPLIPNFDNYSAGIFIKNRHEFGKSVIEYGARYDYKYFDVAGYRYDPNAIDQAGIIGTYLLKDTKHFHNISGALGWTQRFNNNLRLNSNAALAWRAPNANELYADGIHHGTGTYEIGNINLHAERGIKWTSSLEGRWNFLNFQLDAYAQYIDNYIYSNPAVDSVRQTIRGTFPVFQYKQTDAIFYGIDAQVNCELSKHFSYSIHTSWVQAKDISQERYLPYIPAFRVGQYLTYHITSPQTSNSYVKVEHQFVGKQHRYEVGSDFVAPPSAYHLVNFTAHTLLFSSLKTKTSAVLQIDNLFNTKYRDYLDRMRYYSHALGRNISLKLQYSF